MRRPTVSMLTRAAVIAALYAALTLFSNALGIGSGPIQFRLSEILCVLPAFTPAALWGLPLGCMLSALFSPLGAGMAADLVFGSLATFLGGVGTRLLRRRPFLSLLPPILSNALIVPLILSYAYGAEQAIPWLMLSVFCGEGAVLLLPGTLFRVFLQKNKTVLGLDGRDDGFWR